MLQDHELRIKSLKRKLAEVKVRSSTRDQNKSLKENGSFNDSINEVKEKLISELDSNPKAFYQYARKNQRLNLLLDHLRVNQEN